MKRSILAAGAGLVAVSVLAITLPAVAEPPNPGTKPLAMAHVTVHARSYERNERDAVNGANFVFANARHSVWKGGSPNPTALAELRAMNLTMLRFPGGTESNLYDWRRGVGKQHRCQMSGKSEGEHFPAITEGNEYGTLEHLRVIDEMKRYAPETQSVMAVNWARQTPQDAADWVAYVNAARGEWAQRRAADGRREPGGVRHWEVGNEADRKGTQRYWMSQDDDVARRQFAFGGKQEQGWAPVANDCEVGGAAARGGPGNVDVRTMYGPVVRDTVRVAVIPPSVQPSADMWERHEWKQVPDGARVAAGTKGFTVDRSGRIHLLTPAPAGTRIMTRYTVDRQGMGYVDFRKAMKKADPNIRVCSAFADLQFNKLLKEKGEAPADCLALHPYTNFYKDTMPGRPKQFTSPADAYARHMVGEASAREWLRSLRDEDRAEVGVTEFGALFMGGKDEAEAQRVRELSEKAAPNWTRSQMHAVYMASQMVRFIRNDVRFVGGNDLYRPNQERTLMTMRGPDNLSAEGRMRQFLKPVLTGRGQVVRTEYGSDEVRTGVRVRSHVSDRVHDSYGQLVATAVVRDTKVYVAIVNRDPRNSVRAKFDVHQFGGKKARVQHLVAKDFLDTGDKMRVVDGTVEHGTVNLPKHSVTLVEVS